MAHPVPDKSELEELYLEQRLTTYGIAEHYDISRCTVRKWFRYWDIPRRPGGRPPPHPGDTKKHTGRVFVYQPNHQRAHQVSDLSGYVPRAILNWEEANHQLFPEGKIPHHRNETPDDDRPENILPLTRSEHAKLHYRLRRLATALQV